MPRLQTYTRYITQEYIQSHSELQLEVCTREPDELWWQDGFVFKVFKPLYGIPDSGLHWYLTYLTHNLDTFKMNKARMDICVLLRRQNNSLEGLILL